MTLTDLQTQLSTIESQLAALRADIEKMKPQENTVQKADFQKIQDLAERFPLRSDRLEKENAAVKDAYITCLSYMALTDPELSYEKLLYLCRLAYGIQMHLPPEQLRQMGLKTDPAYFRKACDELMPVKYSFLTNALILANLTEEASDDTFSFIAGLTQIMGCDKNDLRVMAHVAKAVLLNQPDRLQQIPVENKNHWMGQFRDHVSSEWIESQRIKCGKYYTKYDFGDSAISLSVKKRLKAGSVVSKGDELVVYEAVQGIGSGRIPFSKKTTISNIKKTEKKILAPQDGVVFFINDEEKDSKIGLRKTCIVAYVVSYFDDYSEFCKWYQTKH